jgi:hypothetical protein
MLGSGRDWSVARLYLSDGASVAVEDLYDDDQVTVAFEGETFFGATEGSARSMLSLLQPPGVSQQTAAAEPPAPLLPRYEETDLAAPQAMAEGGPPLPGEAPSGALLDPSLPRSRSTPAPTPSPLDALRMVRDSFLSLPPHLQLRVLIVLLACLGVGAAGRLGLYVTFCGGETSADSAHVNSTAALLPPPPVTSNCWATSVLDATGRGLGWGTLLSVLGAAVFFHHQGLLPPPRVVDGRVYGVLMTDWARVALAIPLCTFLGAVLGLIVAHAFNQGVPGPEHSPTDGRGASSHWHPPPMHPDGTSADMTGDAAHTGGAEWGALIGFFVGLVVSLVLLMDLVRVDPNAVDPSGALERTRLRRKIRSVLSAFEGRNGVALVNMLATLALGCVLLYFVSVATAVSLEAWRPGEQSACPLNFGTGPLAPSGIRRCRPGIEQCELAPLWMRPTLLQAVREASAMQPLPSPASARVYSTPIGGTRGGDLTFARERLLSSSASQYDVRVCWRPGAPRLQLMPDLLAIRMDGWAVDADAEVSVVERDPAASASFFGRRLQQQDSEQPAAQPDMEDSSDEPNIDYSSFGYLSLLIALDVQPDGSPATGGATLLPGTVAANGTGAEACGGRFERARTVARGALRSRMMSGAELAEAVDTAVVAAASRVAARLCFGDAHPGNGSDVGAAGYVGIRSGAEPPSTVSAQGEADSEVLQAHRVLLAEDEQPERWGLAYDLSLVLSEQLPRLRLEAARQVRLVWAVVTAGLLVFGLAVSVLLCMRCCGNVAAGAHAVGCCCVKVEGHFDGKAQGCCCIYFLPPRTRSADVQRPYDRFFSAGGIDGTDEPTGDEQQAFWEPEQQVQGGPFMTAVRGAMRSAGQMAVAPFEVMRNMFQHATIAR